MNYNFNDLLSADEFELFCRDLLANKFNKNLKTFASGPDGGIDIKYSFIIDNSQQTWVGQCKNYKTISLNIVQKEFDKLDISKISRYFFMTSVKLTDKKTEDIYNIFKSIMDSDEDIFGHIELNRLLEKYPKVLRKYYKLWIGSIDLMQSFFDAENISLSKIKYQEILKDIDSYIFTNIYEDVNNILKKNNYCIIDGMPGIGKTSLASTLLLSFMYENEDSQFIYINDINSFSQYLLEDRKVVFLFDDFLGDIFDNNKYTEKDIKKLVLIINHIKTDNNKKLILTTRSNVFNTAELELESLNNQVFRNKISLTQDKFSIYDKNKIISNTVNLILKGDETSLYWTDSFINSISKHKNFYARLLREILELNLIESTSDKLKYQKEVSSYFDNCELIWEKVFRNKLSDEAILLCYQMIFHKNQSYFQFNLEEFEKSYYNLYNDYCDKFGNSSKKTKTPFQDSILQTKNFITNGNKNYLDFFDNSIRDYLYYFFKQNKHILKFFIENNNLFVSPLNSIVLRHFSFYESKYNINLTNLKYEIIQLLKENISRYNFDDIFIFYRFNKQILLMEDSFIQIIKELLLTYEVEINENNFSFTKLEKFIDLSNDVKYSISEDTEDRVLSVIKCSFEKDNLDVNDLNVIIKCIEEFSLDLSEYEQYVIDIIDEEYKYKYYDVSILEEIAENCESISSHFNLQFCSIATEIENTLSEIKDKKDEELWDEYEYVSDSLESIFGFIL